MPICKTVAIPALGRSIEYTIGKNAADNFAILDEASSNDIWFHIEGQSSCHVIASVPSDIDRKKTRYLIKQGAILCKQYTAKLSNQKNVEIIYAKVCDVEKTAIVGSVIVSNGKTVTI